MFRSTIKFVTSVIFLAALVAAPPVMAAGGGGGGGDSTSGSQMNPGPQPPADTKAKATSTQKKKPNKQSSFEDPAFATGYRSAYATIYDRNEYAAAIEQLEALGHDDHPNVANLIGYSYRKLGDYKLSQVWYERALKADPNHVLTWNYYGLWQIEQGNRDQAQYHLNRIAQLVAEIIDRRLAIGKFFCGGDVLGKCHRDDQELQIENCKLKDEIQAAHRVRSAAN